MRANGLLRRDALSRPAAQSGRAAVTLVELLVMVLIVGLLVALLLPAVQTAREAARRTQCHANLRQLALACLSHETVRGHLPTGGWGGVWAGDPDRGFGAKQPGGWAFNILPHVEQAPLRDLGSGLLDTTAKADQAAIRLTTPLSIFTCASRRTATTWRLAPTKAALNLVAVPATVARRPAAVVRGDYAANMGSGLPPNDYVGGGSFGPTALADMAGDADWSLQFGPPTDGLIFRRSRIRLKDVSDGLSQTYLVGEKYVDPALLASGTSDDDDQCLYSGHDRDVLRTACTPPFRDQPGFDPKQVHGSYPTPIAFGSSHPDACGMALADGSIQAVEYLIDPIVHRLRASRNDGKRP